MKLDVGTYARKRETLDSARMFEIDNRGVLIYGSAPHTAAVHGK